MRTAGAQSSSASIVEPLYGILLPGGESPRVPFVVDPVQAEEPFAVDLDELVVPRAKQHPLDLVAICVVVELNPVGEGRRLVAVDFDNLVRDEVTDRRRPVLAVGGLCW